MTTRRLRSTSRRLTPTACWLSTWDSARRAITLKAICDLLDDFAVNRVLIIAPKFVAQDVWIREAKKWDFAGRLRIHVAVGTQRQRREAIDRRSEIVCINCENVSWLVDHYAPQLAVRHDRHRREQPVQVLQQQAVQVAEAKILPKCNRIVELTGTRRGREASRTSGRRSICWMAAGAWERT
jgi:hypothetical protein